MQVTENKSKSKRGNEFNETVLLTLKSIKDKGVIDNIDMKKRFPYTEGHGPQFYAPFIVLKENKKVLVFTMTTMRSDRNKEKQWDALGIKNYFKGQISVVVVLPDELSGKELCHHVREKKKIKQKNYFSVIDEICQLSELSKVLRSIVE